MLGLFRRNTYHSVSTLTQRMALLTLCERIQPLSLPQYEQAEQSLESFYDWLFDLSSIKAPAYAGHYTLLNSDKTRFSEQLELLSTSHQLPVIVTNCHESILSVLSGFVGRNRDVGIVSIGPSFQLKATLNVELGSAFHFALSRYNECRLLCLGIDDTNQDSKTFEYAEDLGCNWLLNQECDFRHRLTVKQNVATYLSRCDDVVVDIDLASLSKEPRWDGEKSLDVDMVLRMVGQCLESKKVRAIQLTGLRDSHWYSRHTKHILHELCQRFARSDNEFTKS
ncbi:hypothetical protein SAMN04488136_103130 [Vibrio xiamenensis]|uniref:Arginase family protein n=1 Tax=Vibrio xiamenensis TaxID=861298 RepID=A0A1G7XFL9_9VIBR|nr:hypothetical protein [Vibrio xiamenensis]SDG82916.1 hypothetical protein SAMN04488136_103130 [Vibrio xiamenensis]